MLPWTSHSTVICCKCYLYLMYRRNIGASNKLYKTIEKVVLQRLDNLLKWSKYSLSPSSTGLASNSLHTFLGEGSLAPHSFAKLVKSLNTVPQISHIFWFLDQIFSVLFLQHFLSRWPFQLCCSTCRYTEHLISHHLWMYLHIHHRDLSSNFHFHLLGCMDERTPTTTLWRASLLEANRNQQMLLTKRQKSSLCVVI